MPRPPGLQTLSSAPRDGERLQLYDNLLADAAPRQSDGRRVLRPSRRGLVQLGGGLLAFASQPACEADEVEAVIDVIIIVAQITITIAAAIEGETLLTNSWGQPLYLESLFSLIQAEDEQAVDTTSPAQWSIPPGDSMFGFGGLYALDPGPHFVEMLLGGSAHESEQISVRD